MVKVMIISTGGTIASADKGAGAVPDAEITVSILAPALKYLHEQGADCEVVNAFGSAGIDSSNISPKEWLALSDIIENAVERGTTKFLVVHGTDTMAYSAAWLSLTVRGAAVMLTGSQRTPSEDGFDGTENLIGAAKLLCETDSGVFIYFAGKAFSGAFVHKEDSSSLCAYVRTGKGASPCFGLPAHIIDADKAALRLAVVFLHPAYAGGFPKNIKILILCGYGAGNMASRIHDALSAFYPMEERPIIIAASSCVCGEKNPLRYGGVGIAVLSDKNFIVFGQGSYSLEFIIALSYFALLNGEEEAEKILGRCLEKF